MCMIDFADDFVYPICERQGRARKDHTCTECKRTIKKGENYEYVMGKWDGHIEVYKTCYYCQIARNWLSIHCDGWCYTGILEDLEDHWREYASEYRTTELGRLIVGMKNQWTRRNGKLMKLPTVVPEKKSAILK